MARDPALRHLSRGERRNRDRELRKEIAAVEATLLADQMNGAGYPVDQQIRKLLDSCNQERVDGAAKPFVNIWDVFSGFLVDKPGATVSILRLAPERDHAFHGDDFFAFYAANDLAEASIDRLQGMPDGVIHNFSQLGDIHDTSAEDEMGERFVLSGVSMIRLKNKLHWLALGGPVGDLEAVTAQRRAELAAKMDEIRRNNPQATPQMLDDMIHRPRAGALEGTDDVWLTFTMGVFDLETRSHEVRLVGRDWSVSLAVFSDAFEQRYADAYGQDPQITRMIDKAMIEIGKSRSMFELAETAFALPAYFAAKVAFSAPVGVDTALKTGSGPDHNKAGRAPRDMQVMTRSVITIGAGGPGRDVAYTPPRYRVEVDGFYRSISPTSTGKDKNGDPIVGRTWIAGHYRWKDLPPREGVVRVKAPIGPALERAEERAREEGGEVSLRF